MAGDKRERPRDPSLRPPGDAPVSVNELGERALTDPIQFEDLFVTERRRLYGALCLITGDPHEAEDIGQEAFVRLFEHWDRVGSMVDPVGYLYRVAMNVFRGRYRRARIAARRLLIGTQRDELAEIDDRDVVSRMLDELTPRQRAALVLTAILDYSSEEAGEILGLPGSSVRVLTTRARATLRRRPWEGG